MPKSNEYNDAATSRQILARNIRVMAEQGATLREMVLELSRKQDGDYLGEPKPGVQRRVEEIIRDEGLVLNS